MRETKFRVWNQTGESNMLRVAELSWETHKDGIERMHFHGKLPAEMSIDSGGVVSGFGATDGSEDVSPWVLMQYTGLKDKNGTEIYEGDIFRQKGMDNDLIVGTIIFYDDLSYRCREGNYIFHKVKFAGEVIGNIYENPELLEG